MKEKNKVQRPQQRGNEETRAKEKKQPGNVVPHDIPRENVVPHGVVRWNGEGVEECRVPRHFNEEFRGVRRRWSWRDQCRSTRHSQGRKDVLHDFSSHRLTLPINKHAQTRGRRTELRFTFSLDLVVGFICFMH